MNPLAGFTAFTRSETLHGHATHAASVAAMPLRAFRPARLARAASNHDAQRAERACLCSVQFPASIRQAEAARQQLTPLHP